MLLANLCRIKCTNWRNFSIKLSVSCARSCSNCAKWSTLAKWTRNPMKWRLLVRPLRLTGIAVPIFAPFVRFVKCQESGATRSDILAAQIAEEKEPPLSLEDIWRLLRPYWLYFAGAILCTIGVAILNIQLPILLGDLVNIVAEFLRSDKSSLAAGTAKNFNLAQLQPVTLKLLGYYAAQAVLTFGYITLISILGERMAVDLRLRLVSRLLVQEMAFFDAHRTGELNSRLSADVQEFKSSFKVTIAQGLRTFAQTAGCFLSLYFISKRMTLVTVVVLPVFIGIGAVCGALLRHLSRKAQAQMSFAGAIADEAFANIRTVKAFAMEKAEMSLFDREVRKAQRLNESLGAAIGAFQGVTNFFLNGVVLSVLYAGSRLIAMDELTAGDLMSFLVTSQTIQRSLAQMSIVFGQAVRGWTAAARVFEFIHLVPEIATRSGKERIPYHSQMGEIRFEHVQFSYPTRPDFPVFDGFDLLIEPGRVVALVGPSGAGKSTVVALLERFYEPTGGRITIDGRDIRQLDVAWLRGELVGLISQEPVLFATSIFENIRYGRPLATDEEVYEAARAANADDFIRAFPAGYDTEVGERGVTLSGGQKQRVAIARALLKNPPILILDEATSALDSESERIVHDALQKALHGRTVIIIAHRLSTIQHADKIAVIKGRRIAEEGTHEELLRRKGLYYKLIRSQYEKGNDDG